MIAAIKISEERLERLSKTLHSTVEWHKAHDKDGSYAESKFAEHHCEAIAIITGLLSQARQPVVDDSRAGHEALWLWFGLSHAAWLTLPRALMHAMPDKWQALMAELLNEWDSTWVNPPDVCTHVSLKRGNRFTKMLGVLSNYRHPDKNEISRMRSKPSPLNQRG